MRILHYSLGLPPYRTGGLTKYSYDLMIEQIKLKNNIFFLYPGHFSLIGNTRIIKNRDERGIKVYELVNPLPVPLLAGIGEPGYFIRSLDKQLYVRFLKEINPDIIHIHTLMGMHKEFLEAAKEVNIKIIYTSHDYFGFCPKVNLLDLDNKVCEDYEYGSKCCKCNNNYYSMKLIYLMQSKTYRKFKNSYILKKAKNIKKRNLNKKRVDYIKKQEDKPEKSFQYVNLRNYYIRMFKLIDYFHFNSTISENVYKNFFECKGKVINITHKNISDNRMKKIYNANDILKITYLGYTDIYKGFYLLKDSLNKLINKGVHNWILNVYGNDASNQNNDNEFIKYNGKYSYSQLKNIFNNTDVLVVPSIWKETFGYIALESVSFGVPVIVTENVGFKDLIKNNQTGFIIKAQESDLSDKLEYIINNRYVLQQVNDNLLNMDFKYIMDIHVIDILNLYNEVIKNI